MFLRQRLVGFDRRFAFPLFVLSAGIGVLTFAGLTPPQLRVEDGSGRVGDVAIGSQAWIIGVRSGMPAEPWPGAAPTGYDIELAGGVVGVPVRPLVPVELALALGLVLAVGAAALRYVGFPGATAILAAGAGVAQWPAYEAVGLPGAYMFAPVPILIGLTAFAGGRRTALAVGAVVAIVAGLGVCHAVGDVPWSVVWHVPLIGGALIPAVCTVTAGRPPATRLGLRGLIRSATPIERQARLTAADSERDRIASDLHNVVLPRLNDTIAALGKRPDHVEEQLQGLGKDLRGLMMDRQTVVLRTAGLGAAIEVLAETPSDGPSVRATFDDRGRAPASVELAAYRVVQAAIENARRHAHAERIWVRVACSPRRVDVEVSDDGDGFPADSTRRRHVGTGLLEMRARANDVDGWLIVGEGARGGVTISFGWRA